MADMDASNIHLGRWEKAKVLLREVVVLWKVVLGGDHP